MLHKLPNNNLISSGLILLAPTVIHYLNREIATFLYNSSIVTRVNEVLIKRGNSP